MPRNVQQTARRKALVAYYRVSTDKQGQSGLGLEAQQASVASYARQAGLYVAEGYTEVESGKRADRPRLAEAIAHAQRIGAVLCVAKLDRLSRNVAFLANLMESGVEFVACDNPQANKLTVHILAAVAENEREAISQRTKAALAAYKARGGTLGGYRAESPGLTAEARQKGSRAAGDAIRSKARREWAECEPIIARLRADGQTLQAIADALNEAGYTSNAGTPLQPVHVHRVLKRAGV